MPRLAPTSSSSTLGSASRSACASARAGMRWPPVPPPASRTFIAARIASCCPVRPAPPLPHADQHAGRDERDEQARASVRDERQRDPRRRQQRQAHTDVERRGDADQRGEPDREKLAERITRGARDPKPEPHERAEQREDDEYADEPPLLADRRKDEIRVRVGEIAELLLPLPQAHTEQPPRSDADERLLHLPGRLLRPRARRQKGQHPRDAVLRRADPAE